MEVTLESLPSEIISAIAVYVKSPFNIFLISKRFGFLRDDKLFWKQKLERDFPKLVQHNSADPK